MQRYEAKRVVIIRRDLHDGRRTSGRRGLVADLNAVEATRFIRRGLHDESASTASTSRS
jgi:hypothetical protein